MTRGVSAPNLSGRSVALAVVVSATAACLQGCGSGGGGAGPTPAPTPPASARRASSVVKVPGWPDLTGKFPLSFGIKAGGLVFASGMQGADMHSMKLVAGGVRAETNQTLHNLRELLEAAGSSLQDVLICSVSLVNMARDFKAMNEVYAGFWPHDPPARVAVQVAALAGGSSVEIQCDAALSGRGRKVVKVPSLPDPAARGFPLSLATEAEGAIYLSGSQGMDMQTGKLVPGGVGPETTQTLHNLMTVLQAGGSDASRIVACSVSLRNMSDFAEMNKAYAAFFAGASVAGQGTTDGTLPSRVCVEVGALAGTARVEIQCTASVTEVPKTISVPGWPEMKGFPFSPAVTTGGIGYISGNQGVDMRTGKLLPGGAGPETTQTLRNIAEAVKASGGTLADVVACEVSLASLRDFAVVNKAYAAFWPTEPPSRIAVQVGALARGAVVEIRCLVALPSAAAVELTV